MAECKVEVKVKKGKMSMIRADGVRINGIEIPNVTVASITYTPLDVRRISFTIIPTDFAEVDEADW